MLVLIRDQVFTFFDVRAASFFCLLTGNMIPIHRILLLLSVPVFGFGCMPQSGEVTPIGGSLPLPVVPGDTEGIQARPSYENALQLADSVKVGMPQRVVEAMFGSPDKAGYKEYGRAAGAPWRALVWEWVFQDATPPRALSIVFQQDKSGNWRVNHGDWPE